MNYIDVSNHTRHLTKLYRRLYISPPKPLWYYWTTNTKRFNAFIKHAMHTFTNTATNRFYRVVKHPSVTLLVVTFHNNNLVTVNQIPEFSMQRFMHVYKYNSRKYTKLVTLHTIITVTYIQNLAYNQFYFQIWLFFPWKSFTN